MDWLTGVLEVVVVETGGRGLGHTGEISRRCDIHKRRFYFCHLFWLGSANTSDWLT